MQEKREGRREASEGRLVSRLRRSAGARGRNQHPYAVNSHGGRSASTLRGAGIGLRHLRRGARVCRSRPPARVCCLVEQELNKRRAEAPAPCRLLARRRSSASSGGCCADRAWPAGASSPSGPAHWCCSSCIATMGQLAAGTAASS
jgi:hypothetical protein